MGSEARISVSALPGAVLRLGPDGRVIELNETAEELSFCCEQDTSFADCLNDADRPELEWRLSSSEKLPTEDCEFEVTIDDHLYRLQFARSTNPDGSRFIQIADISEYRSLSERVAFNEQRYRSLFAQNPDAVCRLDLNGRLVEVNHCTEHLTGYPADQLLRHQWSSILEKPDQEAAKECFEAALKGNPAGYVCKVRNSDNQRIIAQVTYMPILVKGEVVGVFGVAQDKTESYRLEESQRLLQACMSQIQDVIIITETDPLDPPGPRIVYVNEGVERMTGYRPDEVLGNNPRMFQGPDTDRKSLRRIRKALEHRQPVKEVIVNYCKDGVPFWNEVEIVPIPTMRNTGRSYFAAVQRDITVTKQREARLRHSEEELRRLSRAQEGILEQERRRIARDLHDELGQTLTALKLELGVAVKEMADLPKQHRARLDNAIDHFDAAVEKVREISANLRPPMLDDLGFEAAAEWFLERCAGREDFKVQWNADPAGECRVVGEVATALFRILQECMTNITRHSQASIVEVHYCERGRLGTLEVSDNGIGFDPAKVGASSFGLVGIRERVVMFGGEMVVESAKGKGTRIQVELPLGRKLND